MSKIKVSLTKYDLDRIRDNALVLYRDKHNQELSSDQYVTACYVQAFVDYLIKHGADANVVFPTQKVYEVVDEP